MRNLLRLGLCCALLALSLHAQTPDDNPNGNQWTDPALDNAKAEAAFRPIAHPGLPTLWLIGDSTVRNGDGQGKGGQWGWGDELDPFFQTDKMNVVNRALGGRSSRTYYRDHWSRVLAQVQKGDVILMQFGHNDSGPLDDKARARGTLKGTGDETQEIDNPITRKHEVVHSYGWYLRQFVREAEAKGAIPVICSPIPRKTWEETTGKIHRDQYGTWAHEVAVQERVAFLDLNEAIARAYDAISREDVEKLFADPHTHTSLEGAQLNARTVVSTLRALNPDPVRTWLSKEGDSIPTYLP
ncbi:GDSL-type esterase/lipase family protein [Terriglobus sp. 2YAB30_2]|uniref:GDSL-type esterase/lipase family protein n=1 Tax=unclassified Terriglobus TaxID=2628988 RepID=UPI003F9EA2CA